MTKYPENQYLLNGFRYLKFHISQLNNHTENYYVNSVHCTPDRSNVREKLASESLESYLHFIALVKRIQARAYAVYNTFHGGSIANVLTLPSPSSSSSFFIELE